MLYLYAAYLLVMNIVAFALMGVDKAKAKAGAWRISERRLLSTAVLGGALGTLLGMWVFRHKTRHLSFRIFVPGALLLHVALSYFILFSA